MSGMAVKLVCSDCGEHRFIVERDDADAEHVDCVDCGRTFATSTYSDTHEPTAATHKLRANIYGAIAGVLFALVTVSFQATIGKRASASIGDNLLIPLQAQIQLPPSMLVSRRWLSLLYAHRSGRFLAGGI